MRDTVLILVAFVAVVFWLKSDSDKKLAALPQAAPASTTQDTKKGSTQEAPQDLFGKILGAITSVFDTVGKFASGSPQRN